MKKFLLLALLLFMTACDFGTESKKEVPVIIHDTIHVKDTTKVVARKTVAISDTNIYKTHTLNISGKILLKNNSGKDSVGFSDAVVCLESSKKCVKPNSTGLYSFAPLKTSSLFGSRSLTQSDTTITPEGISPNILPDTVVKIDSNIVRDTIIKNDTIYQIQTYRITRNVYIDSDTTHSDSVIVYSNSRVLYEIPVTSWKSILPEKYVVQRNISGKISKNAYANETKSAEAIYWSVDSLALRIPLELSNDKSVYSGFVYQPYDDSSFKLQIKNKNLFVRIVDQNDSVFGISNVVNFSERAGDLSIFLNEIVPGAILRYPRPNAFRVITEGTNVIKILSDTLVKSYSNRWYSLDSLNYRNQFITKTVVREGVGFSESYYAVDSLAYYSTNFSNVDSVSVRFDSDTAHYAAFTCAPDSSIDSDGNLIKHMLKIDSGTNEFKFNIYDPSKFISSKYLMFFNFDLSSLYAKNVKIYVKFKQ